VMAVTTSGVSAFHEPAPAESWADPWWIFGLAAVAALGLRTGWAIRHRREEAVYWVWAAVSFAPISQVFPFLHPMADRYLYFILPGLIGGAALAATDIIAKVRASVTPPAFTSRTAAALAGVGLLLLAQQSNARALLWAEPTRLTIDAARNYPAGRVAHIQSAKRRVRVGDTDQAMAELFAARARGYNQFLAILRDPELRRLRRRADFKALIDDMTQEKIDWTHALESPTQIELLGLSKAYLARRDLDGAQRVLERALEQGGPASDLVRAELEVVQSARENPAAEITP
jgi:hypothetical protein